MAFNGEQHVAYERNDFSCARLTDHGNGSADQEARIFRELFRLRLAARFPGEVFRALFRHRQEHIGAPSPSSDLKRPTDKPENKSGTTDDP